ncbi:hypothetical protein EKO27_g6810 [Xylaria grammica]|uniref:Diphthamide biosynthesis protein 3 n=1 Tax=Xylaria grammica TaxID=363999 RepID=A0A439D1K6_9PEZI|nr:hypothetical protein EKO27_g6810 [Xylaria grammica]
MADEEEIAVYDEVEIEDMTFDETLQIFHYPCPCGDRFEIALADLQDESTDIAVCPSCSLMIRVIFDQDNLPQPPPDDPLRNLPSSRSQSPSPREIPYLVS